MMKMMKFVKPYRWTLALAVALIFAQANLDLSLPDYLSRIVNTGIQQGGVENALPEAIRASEMDKVAIFLSAADKEDVLASYALVTDSSPDYDSYLKRYPALETQPIYVLNDIPQSEVDRLNPIMAKALLTVSGIEQAMNDPATAAEMGFDPSKLPPGANVFDMLAKLPADQLAQMTDSVDEKFSALGETMIAQAGVNVVRDEYEALGMDTEARQNNYILASGAWMLLLTLLSGAS
ncbi:MAG: ABC transporter, partial [Chloroflexi bacterium]